MNNRSNAIPSSNAASMNARRVNSAAYSAANARTRNGLINATNRANREANAATINAYRANRAASNNPTRSNINAARSANIYASKANTVANALNKFKKAILNYKFS
jgi:hypothetical protein